MLIKEKILVMDFGGQYSQLIARRVRECNVYCEIKPYKISLEEIKKGGYCGIIFSGGSNSVYVTGAPVCDVGVFELGIPILGICYGAQLMALKLGGKVDVSKHGEYGKTLVKSKSTSFLFRDMPEKSFTWMSHMDYISDTPRGFKVSASSLDCPIVAMEDTERKLFALQFHPEVEHTERGMDYIRRFLYDVCNCHGEWLMSSFKDRTVKELRVKIGNKKVLCALSGGVDSSVAAVLMHEAIGKNLTCIFVDHGCLRKNEAEDVERIFKNQFDMNLICVDAKKRFLEKLSGVTDPEKKRKIIGEEFIRVFEEQSQKLGKMDYLCQGTIYPDVVESGTGEAEVIKSHHNVGGLPENVDFAGILEPLRYLFKDEVRQVGLELGIPKKLVFRQPFPGPGLAIRIIGEITEEKLKIVQEADFIFREEMEKSGMNNKLSQYFAALTNMKSVGVMGDGRTYNYTVALRAVITGDFMTADFAHIPYDILGKVSNRIINEVKGVNRVLYDVTSKPPATIEYE